MQYATLGKTGACKNRWRGPEKALFDGGVLPFLAFLHELTFMAGRFASFFGDAKMKSQAGLRRNQIFCMWFSYKHRI